MSEQKYTPGPWEVINQTEVFTSLGADSGDGIKASPSDGWMIADCGGCVTFTEIGAVELGHELRKSNAKLIAAAPDLLEALENLLATYSEPDDQICCNGHHCGCMGATKHQQAGYYAKEAIARARGES